MARRPSSPVARLAVGCDLGGTQLKAVLLEGRRVRLRACRPVPADSAEAVIDALVAVVQEALATGASMTGEGGPAPALAVGVAVPGFLGPRRRTVRELANLACLDGCPLARRLEARLRRVGAGRVVLEADTNAGALAEARLGAGRSAARLLYLSLGTGLGAAMTVGGTVVRVANHTVGQVAHVPLEGAGGPRCHCGRRGCAEAVLSARGICARARALGVTRRAARSPQALFEAAEQGCRAAVSAWTHTGRSVGRLAVTLSHLFSPDLIVLGGGVASAARFFLPAARDALDRGLQSRWRGQVPMVPAACGLHAGAIGAALAAREET